MLDRNGLGSIQYWRSTDGRHAQRFYVAFCLLVAAVQDSLLGAREQERNNLNWSATCCYYGLVHTGRLLSFLALGDYPTGHLQLRELLAGSNHRLGRGRGGRYPFNWLRKFAASGASGEPTPGDQLPLPVFRCADYLAVIQDYVRSLDAHPACSVAEFGEVLGAAAELRNDSNYEALLIAHEYSHRVVTQTFQDLAESLVALGRQGMHLAAAVFKAFTCRDPEQTGRRDEFDAFLGKYLLPRMLRAVGQKLQGAELPTRDLERIVTGLAPIQTGSSFTEVEREVSMEMFSPKARLMRRFEERVQHLRRRAAAAASVADEGLN